MDPASAKLAVETCLSDICDLLDSLYDDVLPEDQRVGLEAMQTEMQQQLVILEGQVLALRILKQEHDARVAFEKLVREEQQATTDHEYAMELSTMDDESLPHVRERTTEEVSVDGSIDPDQTLVGEAEFGADFADDQWEAAKRIYSEAHFDQLELPSFPVNLSGIEEDDTVGAQDKSVCMACYQTKNDNDTITLNRTHTYCRKCLMMIFKSAMADTTRFPPRCCKSPIPVETCHALLPKEMIKDFDLKLAELSTPNPTYCSSWSVFLRLDNIKGGVATCPFCKKKTCLTCKKPKHDGLCPKDPHDTLLLERAKRSHWQQCSRCKQMVELSYGCFHM